MGANQSSAETRSVSMDNPTPAGVIDISDEVVQRLKLGLSKANADKRQRQQEAKQEVRAVPVVEPKKVTPPPPPPVKQPAAPPKTYYPPPTPASSQPAAVSPIPRFAGEPTITAIEMRRQKEIELQQNDQLWRTRIAQLEQTLNKTNAIMEQEYSAAVEDVRKRFTNASATHQLPPCQDLKAQLIACYRAYPGETLKCAEEVSLFRNCVGVHRIKRLDTEAAAAKAA